jgi:pantetheine-phosphate adenylyltransferase
LARRFRTAVLGGTFDRLHRGHRALFAEAFRQADRVRIGLTTDRYLREHPKPGGRAIQPYASRRTALMRHLTRTYPRRAFEVVPLNDPFGGSLRPAVEALVVSPGTIRGARAVNRLRRGRGLDEVRVIVVPLERGSDLRPISSRRIREGVIDRAGRRRTVLVATISGPWGHLRELEKVIEHRFAGIPVRWIERWGAESSDGSARTNALSDAARRLLTGKSEYSIRLALRPGPSLRAVLAAWDVDGRVGSVEGALRRPGDLRRLVDRLFRRRAPPPIQRAGGARPGSPVKA